MNYQNKVSPVCMRK